jgi:hypothetical protein
MLIVEIAAGVFLGLLAYRSVDNFCKDKKCTIPEAIGLLLWKVRLLALICFLTLIAILLIPHITPYFMRFENYVNSRSRHVRIVPAVPDDLPPDPPGYFYLRSKQKQDMNNLPPILRNAQCVSNCDFDNSLWLVPRANK